MVAILSYVLLAGSVIWLVVLWVWVLKEHPGPRYPYCPACNFPTRQVRGTHCPQCGVDLREAGIKTPRVKDTDVDQRFIFGWTTPLVLLAVILPFKLDPIGPKVQDVGLNLQLDSLSEQAGFTITIYGKGSPTVEKVTMVFHGEGLGIFETGVDIPNMMLTDPPNRVSSTDAQRPMNHQALAQYFEKMNVDTSSEETRQAIDELIVILQTLHRTGHRPQVFSSFEPFENTTYSQHTARWFIFGIFLIWGIIWIAGIAKYYKIRVRQRLADNQNVRELNKIIDLSSNGMDDASP